MTAKKIQLSEYLLVSSPVWYCLLSFLMVVVRPGSNFKDQTMKFRWCTTSVNRENSRDIKIHFWADINGSSKRVVAAFTTGTHSYCDVGRLFFPLFFYLPTDVALATTVLDMTGRRTTTTAALLTMDVSIFE